LPDVYLFLSQRDRGDSARLRDNLRAVCEARGWNFQPKVLNPVRTPAGRLVLPLPPSMAAGLYPRTHRTRVATLVLGTDPIVPLRPNQGEAIKYKRTVPLRRFVEYKSCWIRIPNDPANLSWTGVFAGWCQRIDCEGEHDPRCLPFHVFSGSGVGLETEEQRHSFNGLYGPGTSRIDEADLNWVLEPRTYHGTEVLSIAGYNCRPGFHWDVSGHKWQVSTPEGVWQGNGHVNVYPDAHIRPKGSNVRKVF
jgi:hypothetical protein